MAPAMDSLDLVEAVMLIEEVFGPLRMSVGSGFSLPVAFL